MNWWKLATSQPPSIELNPQQGLHEVKIGRATIMYHVYPPGNSSHPEGHVEIASLRVPAKLRGNGYGEAAMRAFTQALDRAGMGSSLGASPLDKRTKLPRLVDFYSRHGYQSTGQRVNPLGHPFMARPPKPVQDANDKFASATYWKLATGEPWAKNGVGQHPHLPDLPIEWLPIAKIKPIHGRNNRPGKPINPKAQYQPLVVNMNNELQDGYHRYYDLMDNGYRGTAPVVRCNL